MNYNSQDGVYCFLNLLGEGTFIYGEHSNFPVRKKIEVVYMIKLVYSNLQKINSLKNDK